MTETATDYEKAYQEVFASLDRWKQHAILEDQRAGIESRILDEFASQVAKKVEVSS